MSDMGKNPKMQLPFILAVAFHAIILLALIINLPVSSFRLQNSASNPKPIVHAAVIDAKEIAAQVQNIQQREQQQQIEKQQKIQELEAQAEAARQAKILEEKRLEQIKADQQQAQLQKEAVAQQAKLEEQRLAQLKAAQKKQQEAEAKAQALKKQQQEAESKALAQKKQAELVAKQNALQQQLMQQQIVNEQQQFKAQQLQGIVNQYRAQILMAISRQWIIPDATDPTISCVFSIDLTPAGVVSQVHLVKSSGNVGLDRAAEAAIHKASPLPVPKDPSAFNSFRHFTLKMTPQDVTH